MTWEQFEWAMEVVHSRAFRGIGGIYITISLLWAVLAPLVAGAAGWYYTTVANPLATTSKADTTTVTVLAVVGVLVALLPSLLQLLQP